MDVDFVDKISKVGYCLLCGDIANAYGLDGELIKREPVDPRWTYAELHQALCKALEVGMEAEGFDFGGRDAFPYCVRCEMKMGNLAMLYGRLEGVKGEVKMRMLEGEEKYVAGRLYARVEDDRFKRFRAVVLGGHFRGEETAKGNMALALVPKDGKATGFDEIAEQLKFKRLLGPGPKSGLKLKEDLGSKEGLEKMDMDLVSLPPSPYSDSDGDDEEELSREPEVDKEKMVDLEEEMGDGMEGMDDGEEVGDIDLPEDYEFLLKADHENGAGSGSESEDSDLKLQDFDFNDFEARFGLSREEEEVNREGGNGVETGGSGENNDAVEAQAPPEPESEEPRRLRDRSNKPNYRVTLRPKFQIRPRNDEIKVKSRRGRKKNPNGIRRGPGRPRTREALPRRGRGRGRPRTNPTIIRRRGRGRPINKNTIKKLNKFWKIYDKHLRQNALQKNTAVPTATASASGSGASTKFSEGQLETPQNKDGTVVEAIKEFYSSLPLPGPPTSESDLEEEMHIFDEVPIVRGINSKNYFYRNINFIYEEGESGYKCSSCNISVPFVANRDLPKEVEMRRLKERFHLHFIVHHTEKFRCKYCADHLCHDLETLRLHARIQHDLVIGTGTGADGLGQRPPVQYRIRKQDPCLVCRTTDMEDHREDRLTTTMTMTTHMNEGERERLVLFEKSLTEKIAKRAEKRRQRQASENGDGVKEDLAEGRGPTPKGN